MTQEILNVIVNRRYVLLFFKLKVSVQAPFRHRCRFKSTGLASVSENTQTMPIPSYGKIKSPLSRVFFFFCGALCAVTPALSFA